MEMRPSVETDSFSLEVFIDSSETLYQIKYSAKDSSYEGLDHPLQAIVDKKITQVLKLGSRDLPAEPTLALDWLLYSVKELIKNYQGSDVSKQDTEQVDISELVCRCKFLDKNSIKNSFIEARGDFKKAILKTNATLICSSCSNDVRQIFDDLEFPEEKQRVEKIKKDITEGLEDFAMFSPAEYAQTTLEVASVKGDTVKIKVNNRPEGLNRKQIQETLENYLGPKLLEGIKLSVFY